MSARQRGARRSSAVSRLPLRLQCRPFRQRLRPRRRHALTTTRARGISRTLTQTVPPVPSVGVITTTPSAPTIAAAWRSPVRRRNRRRSPTLFGRRHRRPSTLLGSHHHQRRRHRRPPTLFLRPHRRIHALTTTRARGTSRTLTQTVTPVPPATSLAPPGATTAPTIAAA